MHVHAPVQHVHAHVHVRVHARVHARVHVYVHVQHVHVRARVHVRVHAHVHAHAQHRGNAIDRLLIGICVGSPVLFLWLYLLWQACS